MQLTYSIEAPLGTENPFSQWLSITDNKVTIMCDQDDQAGTHTIYVVGTLNDALQTKVSTEMSITLTPRYIFTPSCIPSLVPTAISAQTYDIGSGIFVYQVQEASALPESSVSSEQSFRIVGDMPNWLAFDSTNKEFSVDVNDVELAGTYSIELELTVIICSASETET